MLSVNMCIVCGKDIRTCHWRTLSTRYRKYNLELIIEINFYWNTLYNLCMLFHEKELSVMGILEDVKTTRSAIHTQIELQRVPIILWPQTNAYNSNTNILFTSIIHFRIFLLPSTLPPWNIHLFRKLQQEIVE